MKENELKAILSFFREHTTVIIIGAGIAIIIISIIITVAVSRKKKKIKATRRGPVAISREAADSYSDKTEFVGEVINTGTSYTIKLTNPYDISKTWTLPVSGDLLIGRAEHCDVRFDDKSVSREQCKIMVHGNGLSVIHMGSTNKTSLNGSLVVESSPIQSGDTLKFGRVVIHIDYIQAHGTPPSKPEPQSIQSGGKTESLF